MIFLRINFVQFKQYQGKSGPQAISFELGNSVPPKNIWGNGVSARRHHYWRMLISANVSRVLYPASSHAKLTDSNITVLGMGACRFFQEVGKLGIWGRKSPGGVWGWILVGVLGQSLQKLTSNCENNA